MLRGGGRGYHEAVEDDELDVVVALADEELAEALAGGADGGGGLAELREGDGALVGDGRGGRLHEGDDDLHALALLGGVAPRDLADELQDRDLPGGRREGRGGWVRWCVCVCEEGRRLLSVPCRSGKLTQR